MNRLIWLDIAKGIAIILMVMGHSGLPLVINKWIFSFHMPLFFIASGLTTKWKGPFYTFFLKKANSLLLPFFIYSLIDILVLKYYFNKFDLESFLIYGWKGIALWFVPILFLSLLLSYFVLSIKSNLKYVFLFMLPLISSVFDYYDISLPWNLSVAPYATFFIVIGNYLKPIIELIIKSKYYYHFVLFIITIFVSYFFKLDMASNSVNPVIMLSLAAFSGSIFIFFISESIRRFSLLSRILQAIGKETFFILSLSQITLMYINNSFPYYFVIRYMLLVFLLLLFCNIKNYIVKNLHHF